MTEFADIVDVPDDEIDLGRAALAMAADEYPTLDVGVYLARLDDLAGGVSSAMTAASSDRGRLETLNRGLFESVGLRGNVEDYYDPRNSYLNDVLDRRMGIPITLSLVHIEVGRRLGLDLVGVSFPAHFLVRCRADGEDVYVDPFHGGALLGVPDLLERAADALGDEARARILLPRFAAPVGAREILARMARNLLGIFCRRSDYARAVGASDKLCALFPQAWSHYRDRGEIYRRLGLAGPARADLERYLEHCPDADDAAQVEAALAALDDRPSSLH